MAASVRALLKSAREHLQRREYHEALDVLMQVTEEDPACYEAYVFAGKAAFHLEQYQQSEDAYKRAAQLNPQNVLAWQGLAELYTGKGDWPKVYDNYNRLAALAGASADAAAQARVPGFVRKAAEAAVQAGLLPEALACWRKLLEGLPHEENGAGAAVRLELLCRLADAQLAYEEALLATKLTELSRLTGGDMAEVSQLEGEWAHHALEAGAAASTLREIMSLAPPAPTYAQYYDAYLQLLRKSVHGAPVGSMDRHHRRCSVLSFALHTIHGVSSSGQAGGCCITSPYETALAMLEVEGNVAPGTVSSRPSLAGGNFTPRGGSIPPSPRPADLAPISFPASRQGSGTLPPLLHLPSGVVASGPSAAGHSSSAFASGAAAAAALERAASAMQGVGTAGLDLQLSGMEHVAKRLVHAFPWSPAAAVHLALCMRRRGAGLGPNPSGAHSTTATPRGSSPGMAPATLGHPFLSDVVTDLNAALPPQPRTHLMCAAARRRRQIKLLLSGLRRGAAVCPSSAGWLAASELLLEEGAPEAALDAAKQGLTYLATREQLGHEALVQADLLLKLAVGRALAVMAGVAPGRTGFTFETACSVLAAGPLPHSSPHSPTRRSGSGRPSGSGGGGAPAHECPAALRARARRMAPTPAVSVEAEREAAAWLGGLLLRGRVGGGPAPFARLAGSVAAMDLTQQANRCLAQLALVRGDVLQARQVYEGLVAAAALGRVDPGLVPHWAAAEYAAVLAAQGENMAALRQLEAALRSLAVTSTDVMVEGGCREAAAVHHALTARYQLLAGMVCYQLGGEYRCKRGAHAHQHLLAAAAEAESAAACAPEPDHPAAVSARQDAGDAFSLLGSWYQECVGDEARAAKCFQRALTLEPAQEAAGEALAQAMLAAGDTAGVEALCHSCIAASTPPGGIPAATWAVRLLCSMQLQAGQAAGSMTALQAALRGTPGDARLWELLGSAYQQLGRHSAALRSYSRALELGPGRLYCLVQCGMLQLQQAMLLEATRSFTKAVQLQPDHPAALLGAAEALLATAVRHVAAGALGLAGSALREAAGYASTCTRTHGSLLAAWKLLGDILLQHADVPVLPTPGTTSTTAMLPAASGADAAAAKGFLTACEQGVHQRLTALQGARRAYAAALHLNPCQGQVWGDAAMAVHQSARLTCALPLPLPGSSPQAHEGDTPARLFRLASRLVRGGLRLAPTDDALWGLAGELAASHAAMLPSLPRPVPAAAPAGPPSPAPPTCTWVGGDRGAQEPPSEQQLCGQAELCMVRALQLNPRRGPAWAALARLYAARGERELAAAAAERCRLVDPRLVAVWEAMAALTAGDCQAVGDVAYGDALDAWEHAVGLGGAPESWLGYATGEVVVGQAGSAHVLSTALKAAAQLPLLPAAHNTLGLAYEARGDLPHAISCYHTALGLVYQQGSPASTSAQHPGATTQVLSTTFPLSSYSSNGSDNGRERVAAAVKLNLARALTRAGRVGEALGLWEALQGAGWLREDVAALLAYGHALMQSGQAEAAMQQLEAAVKLAELRVLQASSETSPATDTKLPLLWRQLLGSCLACVHAHIRAGHSSEALALTNQHTWKLPPDMPQLGPLAMHIWLVLLTAAAADTASASTSSATSNGTSTSTSVSLEAVASECAAWAAQNQPQLDAQMCAHIHAARSAASAAAGQPRAALSHAAAALHTCPWEPAWRLRVAQAAASLGPSRAESVLRLAPTPLLPAPPSHIDPAAEAAHRHVPLSRTPVAGLAPVSPVHAPLIPLAPGSLTPPATDPSAVGPMEPCGHVLSTAAVLAAQPVAQLAGSKVEELVQQLVRLVHGAPCDAGAWYLLAVLSLQQAADSGQCALYRKAFTRCRIALSHAERALATANAAAQASQPAEAATLAPGQPPVTAVLAGVVLRLLVAISESLLHSRVQGGPARAKDVATDALRWALQHGLSPGIAHRQLARVAVATGDVANADLAFDNATMSATDPLTLPALLDYAHTFLNAPGPARPLPDGLVRALAALQEQAAAAVPGSATPGAESAVKAAAGQLLAVAQQLHGEAPNWAAAREQLVQANKDGKLPAGSQAAGLVLQSCLSAQLAFEGLLAQRQRQDQDQEAHHQPPSPSAGGLTVHQLALEAKWAASSALKLLPTRYTLPPASAAGAAAAAAAARPAGAAARAAAGLVEGGERAGDEGGPPPVAGVGVALQQQVPRATRGVAATCLWASELLLGKKDKAQATLQMALASVPGVDALARLATLQAHHPLGGSLQEARRAAAIAVHQDPTSPLARHLLARTTAHAAAAAH